ncbi:MAG: qcrC [Ilumatobacteraceae bacterium]|nr:qcrC [Ilumatobacteraceae bacterium]
MKRLLRSAPVLFVIVSVLAIVVDHQIRASAAPAAPDIAAAAGSLVDTGRQLFLTGCSGCHGLTGAGLHAADGSVLGPALTNSGEAAAYFYLSTGRMPLSDPTKQPLRKDPVYDPQQIDALVAFVGSLGNGPTIPQVSTAAGDLAAGGEIYRLQCAACHSATGAGGALSYGRAAPSLSQATPEQIGTAIRIGPGQMPVFGTGTISDTQLNGLAAYIEYLHHPDNRGGVDLGGLGPVPEGLLIWMVGIGGLILLCVWIAYTPRRVARRRTTEAKQ